MSSRSTRGRAQSGRVRQEEETISQGSILHAEAHRGGGTGQLPYLDEDLSDSLSPKVQRPHSFKYQCHKPNPSSPILLALGLATNDKEMTNAQVLCSPSIWSVHESKAVYLLTGGPSLYFNFLFCIRVQ